MANEFERIRKASSVSLAEERKKSINWFKDSIADIQKKQKGDPNKIFSLSKMPEIGGMFLYVYDAKTKDKLPFFDMYPLTMPIEMYNDGFLGLNFHYLPFAARLRLLEALVDITDKDIDAKRKLNISYNLLKTYSTQLSSVGYKDCIKRYLYGHVRSSFHKVDRDDWVRAVLLPLQRWSINPDHGGKPPGFRS
jgi:hypothetical protein